MVRGRVEPDTLWPVGLLLLALLAFWGVAHEPVFVDEADNVMGACLIARGEHLYRDFFSHHFPMPYYTLAAFGEPLSCSVLAGRLVGIVSLTLAGAVFVKIARNPGAALALVIVALAAPAYDSQLFLAETVLSAGLIVVLAFLTDHGRRRRDLVSIGLRCIGLTILAWSSPIGLMMAAVVIPIMIVGAGRPLTPIVATCAVSLLVWPLSLLLRGSLSAFFEQAILFNIQVYSTFLDVSLTSPQSLLWQAFSFVRHRFSFVVDWMIGQKTDASPATFAVAFEFLLSLVLVVLLTRARKERFFRLSVGLLVPLTVAREGFHLAPFVVLASFGCVQLLPVAGRSRLIQGALVAIVVVVVRLYFFFLPLELGSPDKLAQSMEPETRILQTLAPDDTVLYLPIAPQGYLSVDRRPGSFHTSFLPWQAALPGAEQRVIDDIEQHRVAVIVLDQASLVWDKYRLSDYAPRLVAHIMSTYHPLEGGDRRKARIFVRDAP
jgi:hypothetical protein